MTKQRKNCENISQNNKLIIRTLIIIKVLFLFLM